MFPPLDSGLCIQDFPTPAPLHPSSSPNLLTPYIGSSYSWSIKLPEPFVWGLLHSESSPLSAQIYLTLPGCEIQQRKSTLPHPAASCWCSTITNSKLSSSSLSCCSLQLLWHLAVQLHLPQLSCHLTSPITRGTGLSSCFFTAIFPISTTVSHTYETFSKHLWRKWMTDFQLSGRLNLNPNGRLVIFFHR